MSSDNEPRMIALSAIAARWGCSIKTLLEDVASGHIRAYVRISTKYVIWEKRLTAEEFHDEAEDELEWTTEPPPWREFYGLRKLDAHVRLHPQAVRHALDNVVLGMGGGKKAVRRDAKLVKFSMQTVLGCVRGDPSLRGQLVNKWGVPSTFECSANNVYLIEADAAQHALATGMRPGVRTAIESTMEHDELFEQLAAYYEVEPRFELFPALCAWRALCIKDGEVHAPGIANLEQYFRSDFNVTGKKVLERLTTVTNPNKSGNMKT